MANLPYGFNPAFLNDPKLLSYPPNHNISGLSGNTSNPPPFKQHQNNGYYWCRSTTDSLIPSNAVVGGQDQDGTTIYVGRSAHGGDFIPAKVIPSKQAAYVAYGGQEHLKHDFEILCEQRFEWVPCCGGNIPYNAVEGGRTSDGERLFVGRCHHDGSLTVGKVHPSHGCLYIPFGGQEMRFDDYEILVLM